MMKMEDALSLCIVAARERHEQLKQIPGEEARLAANRYWEAMIETQGFYDNLKPIIRKIRELS